MKIVTLNKHRGRNPKGYFQNLPWEDRNRAYQWLHRLCAKWDRDLPAWRYTILVGSKAARSKSPKFCLGTLHAR